MSWGKTEIAQAAESTKKGGRGIAQVFKKQWERQWQKS